jgi:hypothetical protein
MTITANTHHNHGPVRIGDADSTAPAADVIELATHRPLAHVLSNTLTIAVDASLEATEAASRAPHLARPALRALRELGLDDRVEVQPRGLRWSHPGTTGVIEVDVHIDATAGGEDGSWLTIRTSFSATDEDARVRLLDAWALIGPLASSLAERAARTIKERAERDEFDDVAPAALAA